MTTQKPETFDEFVAAYDPDGTRTIATVDVPTAGGGVNSPFIVVRHGDHTVILNPMGFDGDGAHLCVDAHAFVKGQAATAGVFGMTTGRRWTLPDTGKTSHGWAAANLVAVLVGEQGEGEGAS